MGQTPNRPKIYHITHWRNLPQIVNVGRMWSDASRIAHELDCLIVGMSEIKWRRLEELEVDCHPGTKVGHYVPFYFCPRSIMLYILHQANHPDLQYRGGQQPIVHLQADLQATVQWAETNAVRWAFSTSNAGAYYTSFYASLDQLGEVNWTAIEATDWRDPLIKDGKQAEFLFHDWFPWELVEKVGVFNQNIGDQVLKILSAAGHSPIVNVEHSWYY
jgi:ssDNA thymidine ADP-ribosyltransferase DarT-like protein